MLDQNKDARRALQESGTKYSEDISKELTIDLDFWKIYEYNVDSTSSLHNNFGAMFGALGNGVIVIDEALTLEKYIACYAGIHFHKLQRCFSAITNQIPDNSDIEIIDYGCGQALATTLFYNYIIQNKLNYNIKTIALIEPSELALMRGILHLNHFIDHKAQITEIKPVKKLMNDIIDSDLKTEDANIKIHLFSNILDISTVDLTELATKIQNTQKGLNYFICTGTYNHLVLARMEQFRGFFDNMPIACNSYRMEGLAYDIKIQRWRKDFGIKMYIRVFYCNFE
ncbi:MAG: hypothetical protein Q8L81_08960 [Bacteroidota bacterium]|nr:hypothetical protein [Bacteroidota bacterium]